MYYGCIGHGYQESFFESKYGQKVGVFYPSALTKRQKKTHLLSKMGFNIKSLAIPYFHMDKSTLSSALSGFTSEFGMGS
ncbi:MAG: hypothetical protein K9L22_09785, partial [Methylococcaceae bacterium]|nr:hypothetical protein [Methylococcaceae bacterium]